MKKITALLALFTLVMIVSTVNAQRRYGTFVRPTRFVPVNSLGQSNWYQNDIYQQRQVAPIVVVSRRGCNDGYYGGVSSVIIYQQPVPPPLVIIGYRGRVPVYGYR